MKLDITSFQSVAAGLPVEGEVCDLPHAMLWRHAGTDPEMAPLIQELAASSIAEIERLIAELREAKDHLQSERERIEQEMVRYMRLTEMASTTAKIISDAVSQWRPAGNPQKWTPFKATASSTNIEPGGSGFETADPTKEN
jgi:hypothetical protein